MGVLFEQELWLAGLLSLLLISVQPLLFARFVNILRACGLVQLNHSHLLIPTASGVWILIIHLPFLFFWTKEKVFLFQVLAVAILTLAGWWDDAYGEKEIKGFRGHLHALRNGKWTSGMGKALAGALTAIVLSMSIPGTVWQGVLRFLLIVLTINLLNLFDLRPGRAWKIFFLCSAVLLMIAIPYATLIGMENNAFYVVLPPFVAACVMFWPDLRGRIMLGDAGANVLGGLLGYWLAMWAPLALQIFWLGMALVIHAYAEKRSISLLIENNPILHKIDHWGRT